MRLLILYEEEIVAMNGRNVYSRGRDIIDINESRRKTAVPVLRFIMLLLCSKIARRTRKIEILLKDPIIDETC
jgi:hypothetical protein